MNTSLRAFLCLPVLLLAACATGRASATAPATAAPSGAPAAFEKTGILAPADCAALSIWPEQYSGSLLVLEVRPHGSTIAAGEVVATLDTVAIDETLHKSELELQSAVLRHRGLLERNRLEGDSAALQLELARSSLARAQRSLEGWTTRELEFAKRSDEMSKRHEQSNVEDQTDELDQLEKMYKADALVDATEDIVIKRSRRQLDMTKTSNQLARDRAKYRNDFDLAMQTEQRAEQVRSQTEALTRLLAQQALDAAARRDAELRSADALREQEGKLAGLRRDREQLVLRAPRAGTLLHGAAKDFRPGRSPSRFERGSQLALRSELFLIADAAPASVALDINDTELAKLADGASVKVEVLGATPSSGTGTLHVARSPRSSSANEAVYEATVALDQGLQGAVYAARAKVVAGDGGKLP